MAFPWDVISWLVKGRYKITPPALSDGEAGELQCTQNGVLKVDIANGSAAPALSSIYRPIGTPVALSWTMPTPRLYGKEGTYASLAGQTISIKLGVASPIVVSLDASTTPAGHRDKINGTSGLSGVCAIRETTDGDTLTLSHASGVSITSFSADSVLESLGFAAGAAPAGAAAYTNVPLAYDGTRTDLCSTPIDIPDGANSATLLLDCNSYEDGVDPEDIMGFDWVWSCLYTAGASAPATADEIRLPTIDDPILTVTSPGPNFRVNMLRQRQALLRWLGGVPAADSETPGVDRRDIPIRLPPGARRIFIAPLMHTAETDAPALAVPKAHRRLSGSIVFGAT